mgnify:CR=1 FL=1
MNWLLFCGIWAILAVALALIIGNIADEDKDGPRHGPPPIK